MSANIKTDSRFDTLKVVMALFIVILHTNFFPDIFIPLVRIAVPLFFIMSAYFFFKKIYKIESDLEAWKVMGKFVKRSLLLYLFWFIVLLPAIIVSRRHFNEGCDVLSMLYSAVFGSTFAASWFIMATVIGVLLVFIMRRYLSVATVIGFLLYLICCEQSNYYGAFEGFNTWFISIFHGYHPVASFPSSIFWICIGAWSARFSAGREGKPKLWLALVIVGFILLYAEHFWVVSEGWQRVNDCYVSLMILCPAIFMWVKQLPSIYYKASLPLRHSTVIVYCLHGSVAFGLNPVMKSFQIDQPMSGIVVFVITMIVVSLASWIILSLSKTRFFYWLKIAY